MTELPPRTHNQPPSQAKILADFGVILNEWLKEHPVYETEEQVRGAKLLADRARLGVKDADDERKAHVRPLRDKIEQINGEYRPAITLVEKLDLENWSRINAWFKKEEAERQKAAAEAREEAERTERLAREAEQRESCAKDDARVGAEVDVAVVTREADRAFEDFRRAERAVARAEADTNVRIRGGFGRAISSKLLQAKSKSLVVTDPDKVLAKIGWGERLLEALKTEARLYQRKYGHWPEGIAIYSDRE